MKKTIAIILTALTLFLLVGLTARESFHRSLSVSITKDGEMTVTLPDGFTAKRDELVTDGELLSLYNITGTLVTDTNLKIQASGFLSETHLTEPLEKYLETSDRFKSAAIYDLTKETITANGAHGHLWTYKIKQETGPDTLVRTAFFSGVNKFYTVQLSAPSTSKNSAENTEKISESLDAAFLATIKTLKFTNGSVQSGKLL